MDSSGNQAENGVSSSSSISADGCYVAFSSSNTDLVADDTNGFGDVFVHEREDATRPGDCVAPTTTAVATTGGRTYVPDTWTNEAVEITLGAQDDEGGSGLKELTYSATGAQPITSTIVPASELPKQLPVIAAEGTTTVSYFATDEAGNRESPEKTFEVRLDKSVPTVTGAAPTGTGVGRGTDLTAAFSEEMDPASITTTTFKLFKCPSTTSTNCTTQVTNVTVSPGTSGLSATLNPYGTSSTLLASRTRYKAVVTTGIRDLAGNALDQDPSTVGDQQKAWYFTTGRQ